MALWRSRENFSPEDWAWINEASTIDSAFERQDIVLGIVEYPSFEENKDFGLDRKVNGKEYYMHKTQPPPKKRESIPIWDLVIKDMYVRNEFGKKKYGVALQANNGRDSLQDAYEEALDLAVYLRQTIEERKTSGKLI